MTTSNTKKNAPADNKGATTKSESEEKEMQNDNAIVEDTDPFGNLDNLKLAQDFHTQVGVKKILVRVPVRKPTKQEFIRVHAEPEYRLDTAVIDVKDDREIFLLAPDMRDQLPGEWIPVRIFTAINRQGVVFLWPCRLPDPDTKTNPWHETALAAAESCMGIWTKVVADMDLGGYQTYQAQADLPDPEWPEHTFNKLLRVGFGDRFIQDMDHPVVKRLLGYE